MGVLQDAVTAVGRAFRPARAGDEKLAIRDPYLIGPRRLEVESSSFPDGSAIPRRFTADGGQTQPALSWSGVPAGTRSVVLLCEDPDAPRAQPYCHWVVVNISPSTAGLAEGQRPGQGGGDEGVEGVNSGGASSYAGPSPPPGHGVHRYHFELFALDRVIPTGNTLDRRAVVEAMKGHVLASGELVGRYERP
jgi:Raf kinase inhibitor-like YbhB/YbcL family protein